MDRISGKDQLNDSSRPDALAQPLKLRDSLRIRDGLDSPDDRPARWPDFRAVRLTSHDLDYFWVSNN